MANLKKKKKSLLGQVADLTQELVDLLEKPVRSKKKRKKPEEEIYLKKGRFGITRRERIKKQYRGGRKKGSKNKNVRSDKGNKRAQTIARKIKTIQKQIKTQSKAQTIRKNAQARVNYQQRKFTHFKRTIEASYQQSSILLNKYGINFYDKNTIYSRLLAQGKLFTFSSKGKSTLSIVDFHLKIEKINQGFASELNKKGQGFLSMLKFKNLKLLMSFKILKLLSGKDYLQECLDGLHDETVTKVRSVIEGENLTLDDFQSVSSVLGSKVFKLFVELFF